VAQGRVPQGSARVVDPARRVRIAARHRVRGKAKRFRIGRASLGRAVVLAEGLSERELVGRELRVDPDRRLRLGDRRFRIAGAQRPARRAQQHGGEQAVRTAAVDRRIGPRRAPEQLGHPRQRVLGGGAPLSRLQAQSGREPIVARRRGRRVFLAKLAEHDGALGQSQPLGSVLLAPDAECLGPDGAGERLGTACIGADRLQVEVLRRRRPAGLASLRPGRIRLREQLRHAGARLGGDRLDGRRLVQSARARGAEDDGCAFHCARR